MNQMVISSFFVLLLWAGTFEAKQPLRVTVVQNKPWIMLKEDSSNRVGNDRYEGFLVDLLEKLAGMYNINFELQEQSDGRYGARDESGNWSGMIGSVVSGAADLALGDITITSGREQAVDFSVPFLQTGITILYSANSWKSKTINNIEDLVKSGVKFGCVRGGSTEKFFKNSPNPIYRQAWEKMTSEGIMTTNNAEGIERVLENPGEYAYLIESSGADWAMTQYCDLQAIGGDINLRNYGIAMKLGSKLRKDINIGLLKLMEDSTVSQIKNKWWKKSNKCNQVMAFLTSFADLF